MKRLRIKPTPRPLRPRAFELAAGNLDRHFVFTLRDLGTLWTAQTATGVGLAGLLLGRDVKGSAEVDRAGG